MSYTNLFKKYNKNKTISCKIIIEPLSSKSGQFPPETNPTFLNKKQMVQ